MIEARQVMLGIVYWKFDRLGYSGLPDSQLAYDKLYWESLVYQAIVTRKTGLTTNIATVRRILATPALACEVPLTEPVAVYYPLPVILSEQYAEEADE